MTRESVVSIQDRPDLQIENDHRDRTGHGAQGANLGGDFGGRGISVYAQRAFFLRSNDFSRVSAGTEKGEIFSAGGKEGDPYNTKKIEAFVGRSETFKHRLFGQIGRQN